MKDAFFNPYAPVTGATKRLLGVSSVLCVLALWFSLSMSGMISENKLPSPAGVVKAFSYLAWDGDFVYTNEDGVKEQGRSLLWNATKWSVGRIFFASLLVIAVGLPIGIMMGASPKINQFLSPLIDPFRSAPMVALLPVIVMWFGIGETMKIIFLFVGSVVYLVPMVRDAIKAVPQSYWISTRDLGATPFECIYKAVLPMAMPRIMDSIIVAVSVMWTYITVAEYVNAKQGLGQMIQNSLRFSAMDQVFAGIIVIIALALVTYQLMNYVKAKLYPWETK